MTEIKSSGECVRRELEKLGGGAVILERRSGDVTGFGRTEVLLIGIQPDGPEGLLCERVTLLILLPCWDYCVSVPLECGCGYAPALFLGDFTGRGKPDIMVSIDPGGSGEAVCCYIFSYNNCRLEKLFDFRMFNAASRYAVTYEDGFRVSVASEALQRRWRLDISGRDERYLSEIYSPAGELFSPLDGAVSPLVSLAPCFDRYAGHMVLEAVQTVSGMYASDVLGFVTTLCRWEGRGFVADRVMVSAAGGTI